MKKKRGIQINFNLSNRAVYSLITLTLILIVSVGVYAVVDTTQGWHDWNQIDNIPGETDPTVLDSVKDGVSWSEVSGSPQYTNEYRYFSVQVHLYPVRR